MYRWDPYEPINPYMTYTRLSARSERRGETAARDVGYALTSRQQPDNASTAQSSAEPERPNVDHVRALLAPITLALATPTFRPIAAHRAADISLRGESDRLTEISSIYSGDADLEGRASRYLSIYLDGSRGPSSPSPALCMSPALSNPLAEPDAMPLIDPDARIVRKLLELGFSTVQTRTAICKAAISLGAVSRWLMKEVGPETSIRAEVALREAQHGSNYGVEADDRLPSRRPIRGTRAVILGPMRHQISDAQPSSRRVVLHHQILESHAAEYSLG
jgi:hypothetical protein